MNAIDKTIALREPHEVMKLERLGSLHQTPISFVRSLLRQVSHERWDIKLSTFDLDNDGVGKGIYKIQTPENIYHCIIFAHQLDDDKRSDRVIAEAWDITFCLIEDEADDEMMHQLSLNVPLQEAGRNNSKVLVLSRANKSVRNFNYVVDELSAGNQPDINKLAEVGYLYRTTAVYGNGKFGIADYKKLCHKNDFRKPFSAQMFAVYLLRDFCIKQAEHVAKQRSENAVSLKPSYHRYLGIGNSTGLGMAPFLINHPGLISQWLLSLEMAITIAMKQTITTDSFEQYLKILEKAQRHFSQTSTVDAIQMKRYQQVVIDIKQILSQLKSASYQDKTWHELLTHLIKPLQLESQELFNSALLELYPDEINYLSNHLSSDETYDLDASMRVSELIEILESRYRWTAQYDFNDDNQNYWFWYRSEEKEEPRLGVRAEEMGSEKEMHLCIAKRVQHLKKAIELFKNDIDDNGLNNNTAPLSKAYVADFLMQYPDLRGIVRRVQSMNKVVYPEIHGNLNDKTLRPLDLLRCKLSFFGASKFDPKSDKWVRITMFQGAPMLSELGQNFVDNWYFPIVPDFDGLAKEA